MATLKLNADGSVKKSDWPKIEALPKGQYENDHVSKTGFIFKVVPATWLESKKVYCVNSSQYQTTIEI
jgi:hypothetical protein